MATCKLCPIKNYCYDNKNCEGCLIAKAYWRNETPQNTPHKIQKNFDSRQTIEENKKKYTESEGEE